MSFKLRSGNKPKFKEIGSGKSPLAKPNLTYEAAKKGVMGDVPDEFNIRETSGGNRIATMKDWGSTPATYRQETDSYETPWDDRDVDEKGDYGFREKYYNTELNRINQRGASSKGIGIKSLGDWGDKKGWLGRKVVGKGVTKTHGPSAVDAPGDEHIEKYLEGKRIAKSTRRKKGSLKTQRDKTKRKKKGWVRKTGEGFLGLQNRRKWVDGVEVTKNK